MPAVTRPKGVNGSLSCVSALSRRLMNTWVARLFGTPNANATVPRVFEIVERIVGKCLRAPRGGDGRIAVDAELHPSPGCHAEESVAVVVARTDQTDEAIGAARRPCARDFDVDHAPGRFQPDQTHRRRALAKCGRIRVQQVPRLSASGDQCPDGSGCGKATHACIIGSIGAHPAGPCM